MEGSGAGFVFVTYGSGRPQNIRILRIRIPNTGVLCMLTGRCLLSRRISLNSQPLARKVLNYPLPTFLKAVLSILITWSTEWLSVIFIAVGVRVHRKVPGLDLNEGPTLRQAYVLTNELHQTTIHLIYPRKCENIFGRVIQYIVRYRYVVSASRSITCKQCCEIGTGTSCLSGTGIILQSGIRIQHKMENISQQCQNIKNEITTFWEKVRIFFRQDFEQIFLKLCQILSGSGSGFGSVTGTFPKSEPTQQ